MMVCSRFVYAGTVVIAVAVWYTHPQDVSESKETNSVCQKCRTACFEDIFEIAKESFSHSIGRLFVFFLEV